MDKHCKYMYCSVISPNCALALMAVVGSNLLERNTIFNISFCSFNHQKNKVEVLLKRFLKFHSVYNVQERDPWAWRRRRKKKNKIGTWASEASNCFLGC